MSTTSLQLGEIVHAEVRELTGTVSTYSHEYPVDASRLIRIPDLSPIIAEGKPLTPDLRDEIHDRLIADRALSGTIAVNLSLAFARVDWQRTIQPGDTLFVRFLDRGGKVDPASGSFPVDGSGTISIPFLGSVLVRDHRLFEAEHAIEQGLLDGRFFPRPLVNVTRVHLS
ncbi:polysaccharide biosynthesis/export family protein [Streptomyces sp. MN13]